MSIDHDSNMNREEGKENNKISFRGLTRVLIEDIRFYCGTQEIRLRVLMNHLFFDPSLQLVLLYRWSHFSYLKGWRGMAVAIEWLENVLFGCLIAFQAEIGKHFRIAHPIGIVIGLVKIGDNVAIWQNVTIGAKGRAGEKKSWPVIDDNVRIFASAVVAGGIRIGEGSTIGALAFINRDVPPRSLALTERTIYKPAGENEEDER